MLEDLCVCGHQKKEHFAAEDECHAKEGRPLRRCTCMRFQLLHSYREPRPTFTAHQYDVAIANLQAARTQLIPDGNGCAVCGDSGHQAFECNHNPLVAMQWCVWVAEKSEDLHNLLHFMAGLSIESTVMGHPFSPGAVIMPEREAGS